jgi:hypothetical protein
MTRTAKVKAAKRGDPLAREIEATLRPIMGTSAEKADLLVEHLAQVQGQKLDFVPRGIADATRRLRAAKLSDAKIRAGAKALVAELSALYCKRETVV